jgi:hypothetical protein
MSQREPLLIIATGTKGVGKTYETCHVIENYIKSNEKTGKKARKVLIFDINMEYTAGTCKDNGVTFEAKILDIKDLPKWTKQSRVEVRRIVPKDENGRLLNIDGMVKMLDRILYYYRGGLLVLEDINRYLVDTRTAEIIGTMATNRHRDLDIYIHLQSLAPVTTRMWQNTQVIRFHKQADDINRYKQRIPNAELYFIAEKLVNQKTIRDKRFFCYVQNEYSKINGKFSIRDFQKACYAYLLEHPKMVSNAQSRFGKGKDGRDDAMKYLLNDLLKYYGNPINR